MPSVAQESKRRAKLLQTLEQSRAHFIPLGSSSSAAGSDEESFCQDEEEATINDSSTARGGEGIANASRDTPASGRADSSRDMSVRYSRVTSGDGGSPATEAEQSKRRRSLLADRISNKLHALFWVVVGVAVVYRTDFIRVLVEDERVDRLWFNIGLVCFSVNAVILAYLTVWLPHVRGIRVSWNVYSPRAIPTATVVGLICALALNMSLWNVWGFLTPLILFAVFIGCLFSLHFVPWPC
ncbi:unnamed protein product [Ectocarpus sp. 4 AP-2014]